jgi:hypothetical protein
MWAQSPDCAGLPIVFTGNQFPTGNFFSNFDNDCYNIAFSTGDGSGGQKGDLNSVYNKLYYNVNPDMPPYQLIILGNFPNSRYFSVTVYDNHSAVSQNLTDVNIVPLTAKEINPFQPGVAYVSGQQYAIPINLGGTPGTIETGCSMTGFNVSVNGLDGTQRHPFMNWNLNPLFAATNPPEHEVDTPSHTNPNPAGAIIIRSYLNMTGTKPGDQPHVIVRDVASGCAYPAAYVNSTMNAVTASQTVGSTWLHHGQSEEHNAYEAWFGANCWGAIPDSSIQWARGPEYTSGGNPDAGYSYGNVAVGLPQTLLDTGEVMRLRFRVPTTPPTPCTSGCSRTGDEQIRYVSISFQSEGGITLASLPDHCPTGSTIPCAPLNQDPNGYVTLVVSTGTPQPAWVNSANGYTWLDLSKTGDSNYMDWNQIAIRNILPSSTFECPASYVPYHDAQATTAGAGVMGLYAPVVDYPVAASLPSSASPITGPSTCAAFPNGTPNVSPSCRVLAPPPISISSVTTQRTSATGKFVVQTQPPVSISGAGFGSFPLGLPYTGNSNFLEITDATQNWSAGYTGSFCNANVGEWTDTFISVVANVNQDGACPLVDGDHITITVWNPQDLSTVTYKTTVTTQ